MIKVKENNVIKLYWLKNYVLIIHSDGSEERRNYKGGK
ncbi:hypothetical protein [Staphylococcus phage PMBT9]|nr:hypothetical protein [Staphylococcus phage PMBT9]